MARLPEMQVSLAPIRERVPGMNETPTPRLRNRRSSIRRRRSSQARRTPPGLAGEPRRVMRRRRNRVYDKERSCTVERHGRDDRHVPQDDGGRADSGVPGGRLGSIGLSALLRLFGKKDAAVFVGQWSPTFNLFALAYEVLRPSGEDIAQDGHEAVQQASEQIGARR